MSHSQVVPGTALNLFSRWIVGFNTFGQTVLLPKVSAICEDVARASIHGDEFRSWDMTRMFWTIAAVLVLWLFPVAIRAADPVLVFSLKSYGELLSDSKHLAEIFNSPSIGSLPQVVDRMTKGRGLKGLDSTKRIGSFLIPVDANESFTTVHFVPVTDAEQFEQTLETLFSKPDRGGELPKYDVMDTGLFAKRVGSYFFFSDNAALLKDPPDPARFVKATDDLAIEVNLALLFEQYKQEFLGLVDEMEKDAERLQDDPLGSDESKRVMKAAQDFAKKLIFGLIHDSDGAFVGFNVDSQAKSISLEAGHRAKPNTEFAAAINQWGKVTSPFTGLLSPTTVGSILLSLPVNKQIQSEIQSKSKLVEEELNADLEKSVDFTEPQKQEFRRLIPQFAKWIEKTFTQDRFDVALIVNADNPDDLQVLIAWKVPDGQTLAKLLEERIKFDLKTDEDRKLIAWNVATIDGAAVHRAEISVLDLDEYFKGPIHWGVVNDTVYLVVGRDSLERLKSAAAAKPIQSDAPVSIQLDVVRITSLFEKQLGPDFTAVCKRLADQGPGRVSWQIVSRPDEFRVQWKVNDSVLELARYSFGDFFEKLAAGRSWPLPRRIVDNDRDTPAVSWRPKPGTRLRYRVRLTDSNSVEPKSKRDIEATLALTFGERHEETLHVVAELEQYSVKSSTGPNSLSVDTKLNSAKQAGKATAAVAAADLLESAKRACREPRLLSVGMDGLVITEFARPATKRTPADSAIENDMAEILRSVFVPVDRKEVAPNGSWITTETVDGIQASVIARIDESVNVDNQPIEVSLMAFGTIEKPGQEWPETTLTRDGSFHFQATEGYVVDLNQSEKLFTLKGSDSTERLRTIIVELIRAEHVPSPDDKFAKVANAKMVKVVDRLKGDQTPTPAQPRRPFRELFGRKESLFELDRPSTEQRPTPQTQRPETLPDLPDTPDVPDTKKKSSDPRRSPSGSTAMRPSERGQDSRFSSRPGSSRAMGPPKGAGTPRAGSSRPPAAANPGATKKPDADNPSRDRTIMRPTKSYPIRTAIPSGSELVAANTTIPKGTKLKIEWGGRWRPVTVLEDSSEGPITVRWDEYSSAWDEPVNRDSIVIDKQTQTKLSKAKVDKP